MGMFVSRSLDYALRSLIHLAAQPAGEPVSLRELAEAEFVPRSYLAKLMRNLVRGGLIASDAGAHGGYRLSREPERISLREIYEVVEGRLRTVLCADDMDNCELIDECTQVPVWQEIESEILGVLSSRSLADFIDASPTNGGFVPLERVDAGGGQAAQN